MLYKRHFIWLLLISLLVDIILCQPAGDGNDNDSGDKEESIRPPRPNSRRRLQQQDDDEEQNRNEEPLSPLDNGESSPDDAVKWDRANQEQQQQPPSDVVDSDVGYQNDRPPSLPTRYQNVRYEDVVLPAPNVVLYISVLVQRTIEELDIRMPRLLALANTAFQGLVVDKFTRDYIQKYLIAHNRETRLYLFLDTDIMEMPGFPETDVAIAAKDSLRTYYQRYKRLRLNSVAPIQTAILSMVVLAQARYPTVYHDIDVRFKSGLNNRIGLDNQGTEEWPHLKFGLTGRNPMVTPTWRETNNWTLYDRSTIPELSLDEIRQLDMYLTPSIILTHPHHPRNNTRGKFMAMRIMHAMNQIFAGLERLQNPLDAITREEVSINDIFRQPDPNHPYYIKGLDAESIHSLGHESVNQRHLFKLKTAEDITYQVTKWIARAPLAEALNNIFSSAYYVHLPTNPVGDAAAPRYQLARKLVMGRFLQLAGAEGGVRKFLTDVAVNINSLCVMAREVLIYVPTADGKRRAETRTVSVISEINSVLKKEIPLVVHGKIPPTGEELGSRKNDNGTRLDMTLEILNADLIPMPGASSRSKDDDGNAGTIVRATEICSTKKSKRSVSRSKRSAMTAAAVTTSSLSCVLDDKKYIVDANDGDQMKFITDSGELLSVDPDFVYRRSIIKLDSETVIYVDKPTITAKVAMNYAEVFRREMDIIFTTTQIKAINGLVSKVKMIAQLPAKTYRTIVKKAGTVFKQIYGLSGKSSSSSSTKQVNKGAKSWFVVMAVAQISSISNIDSSNPIVITSADTFENLARLPKFVPVFTKYSSLMKSISDSKLGTFYSAMTLITGAILGESNNITNIGFRAQFSRDVIHHTWRFLNLEKMSDRNAIFLSGIRKTTNEHYNKALIIKTGLEELLANLHGMLMKESNLHGLVLGVKIGLNRTWEDKEYTETKLDPEKEIKICSVLNTEPTYEFTVDRITTNILGLGLFRTSKTYTPKFIGSVEGYNDCLRVVSNECHFDYLAAEWGYNHNIDKKNWRFIAPMCPLKDGSEVRLNCDGYKKLLQDKEDRTHNILDDVGGDIVMYPFWKFGSDVHLYEFPRGSFINGRAPTCVNNTQCLEISSASLLPYFEQICWQDEFLQVSSAQKQQIIAMTKKQVPAGDSYILYDLGNAVADDGQSHNNNGSGGLVVAHPKYPAVIALSGPNRFGHVIGAKEETTRCMVNDPRSLPRFLRGGDKFDDVLVLTGNPFNITYLLEKPIDITTARLRYKHHHIFTEDVEYVYMKEVMSTEAIVGTNLLYLETGANMTIRVNGPYSELTIKPGRRSNIYVDEPTARVRILSGEKKMAVAVKSADPDSVLLVGDFNLNEITMIGRSKSIKIHQYNTTCKIMTRNSLKQKLVPC